MRRLLPIASILLSLPATALAQGSSLKNTVLGPAKNIANLSQYSTSGDSGRIYDVLGAAISLGLGFVGVIFIILAIYGGFQWMTAGGNEQKVTEAQNRLKNGVIGAIIVFAAYVATAIVLNEVCRITGVNCTQ